MKKVKILFLLLVIILLSGCSGNYDIVINEDLSVNEKLDLKIEQGEQVYEKTLKLFENNNIPSKKYDVTASEKDVRIEYKEKYDSIEEYILDSKIYKNLFGEIKYTNINRKINIETDSRFLLSNKNSEYIVNDLNIGLLNINLKTPYKILKSNADKKEDNIYIWSLNKNTKRKSISFDLDISKNKNSYKQIIVIGLIFIIVTFSIIYIIRTFINRQKMK